MAINDIYKSISGFFAPNSSTYTAAPDIPKSKIVDPKRIPDSIRYLESSGGMDPNTPRNQIRNFTIPAVNRNEKPRTIQYNIGYGGEYGLTPVALGELAKSSIDRNAATSTYTKYGAPLTPGIDPKHIQNELMSTQGAGRLADLYFNRKAPKDFTPETLASHYIENYVGKGTQSDTSQNRKRVLDYYNSIAQ